MECADTACYFILFYFADISTYSSLSMELCTASISRSAQRSHISTLDCRVPCHGCARSSSWVSQRRRQSSLYVMNAASTGAPPSSQNIRQLPRTNGAAVKSISSNQPSSALEQLDIERGVCIPFRKYTPEMVRNTSLSVYVYRITGLVCRKLL